MCIITCISDVSGFEVRQISVVYLLVLIIVETLKDKELSGTNGKLALNFGLN